MLTQRLLKIVISTLFLFGNTLNYGCESKLTSDEIINGSIQFHDPENTWPTLSASFQFEETRPNGSTRSSAFEFNNTDKFSKVIRKLDSVEVMYAMNKSDCLLALDGNNTFSEEAAEVYSLNCERAQTMCNYYLYLWGLPMKLKDPGTIVHEEYELSSFDDEELLKVKVTYDPKVGSDTWYFYFDPETYEMKGYQFYHDERINDGEFITFADSYSFAKSLRLPNNRKWFINKDSTFLGEDILVKAQLIQ